VADYVPMTGPLPGERYMPSNGTEGYSFIEEWCSNCAKDKPMSEGKDFDDCTDDEVCQILGASFRNEAVEWRELEDGRCVCLDFVQAGTEVAPPRCEHTRDMFGDDPAELMGAGC
jgi:hypothetical protein